MTFITPLTRPQIDEFHFVLYNDCMFWFLLLTYIESKTESFLKRVLIGKSHISVYNACLGSQWPSCVLEIARMEENASAFEFCTDLCLLEPVLGPVHGQQRRDAHQQSPPGPVAHCEEGAHIALHTSVGGNACFYFSFSNFIFGQQHILVIHALVFFLFSFKPYFRPARCF